MWEYSLYSFNRRVNPSNSIHTPFSISCPPQESVLGESHAVCTSWANSTKQSSLHFSSDTSFSSFVFVDPSCDILFSSRPKPIDHLPSSKQQLSAWRLLLLLLIIISGVYHLLSPWSSRMYGTVLFHFHNIAPVSVIIKRVCVSELWSAFKSPCAHCAIL